MRPIFILAVLASQLSAQELKPTIEVAPSSRPKLQPVLGTLPFAALPGQEAGQLPAGRIPIRVLSNGESAASIESANDIVTVVAEQVRLDGDVRDAGRDAYAVRALGVT